MRVILFNVYPYRERFQKAKTIRVCSELGLGLALALALVWAVSGEFSERLNKQQTYKTELSRIEGEIASRVSRVQAMKDEAVNLRRQVDALEAVERDALVASTVLSYLDAGLPKTVGLKRLSFSQNVLTVQGAAESVQQLARWVESMEKNSALFKRVDLVSVKEDGAVKPVGTSVSAAEEESMPHLFELRLALQAAPVNTSAGEMVHVTAQ